MIPILALSLAAMGCTTHGQVRQLTAEPVHLVAVVVESPETLASPPRRRLTDVELTVDGEGMTPFVVYRAPGNDSAYQIDLSALRAELRERYELALRGEPGTRLATVEETAALPGVDSITDREGFETFVATRNSGTYLFVQVSVEPDLTYPRVSRDFELEDERLIAFKASENVPRIIQIDLSARLDLRTPERPGRNLIRHNFNLNYARTGTPNYPTEVLRRPVARLAAEPPGPVLIAVYGGTYHPTIAQQTVEEDLSAAATELGMKSSRLFF